MRFNCPNTRNSLKILPVHTKYLAIVFRFSRETERIEDWLIDWLLNCFLFFSFSFFFLRNWLMQYGSCQVQDLQSESWSPRRASGVVPAWTTIGLRPRKSRCFSLSPKAGEKQCPSSTIVRQDELPVIQGRVSLFFLFRPSTVWTRPTTLAREICFTQSVNLNVNLPKTPSLKHPE